MILTDKEEKLLEAVRSLPPELAEQLVVWTSHVAERSQTQPVDWSETWSDEDIADAVKGSVRHLEEQEQNGS